MHLVDGHRRAARIGRSARRRQPARCVARGQRRGHDARRARSQFGLACVRVGLQWQRRAVCVEQCELVAVAHRSMRHEELPHARGASVAHRVAPPVPGVEVAHHAHAPRVGRPQGKAHAVDRVYALAQRHRMRAQHLPGPQVRALHQEVQVRVGDQRAVAVGVAHQLPGPGRPVGSRGAVPAHAQPVVEDLAPARQPGLEEAAAALALEERGHAPAALGVVQHHLRGPGQQGAHPQVATRIGVHPERREGVGVAGLQQVL